MAMQRACDIPGYEYFSDTIAVDDVSRLLSVRPATIRIPQEDVLDLMLGVAIAEFFAVVIRHRALALLPTSDDVRAIEGCVAGSASSRQAMPADRERVRKWLATHYRWKVER